MAATELSNDGGPPPGDLQDATATQLLALYARKVLSPVEVAEAVLARIDALNPRLNCFVVVDAERTLQDARASEARWHKGAPLGALDGVPVSVKDLLLTAGWPTRKGSLTVPADGPWEEDAPAVARLREHGAVLLGKTSTPEYGHKGTTSSILCGVTRNPWNPDLTPGGSSGGAGAAVAGGMGPLALGTDGGGSVRIPSSFTGLFGHKPSFGRVPAWPISLFGTVANVGPMARTVADGALLYEVITGPDHRDFHALPPDDTDYRAAAQAGAEGLRVGYTPDFGMLHAIGEQGVDPAVAAVTRDAAAALRRAGADVQEISIEWPRDPVRIFRLIWIMGAARLADDLSAGDYELLDPNLQSFCEAGKTCGLAEYYEAQEGREALWAWLTELFRAGPFDVLLGPTMPVLPFGADQNFPDGWESNPLAWVPFTPIFNLTRHPAASVNAGFSQGLPVGVQLVGPWYQDHLVFQAAGALERELGLVTRRPPL
ncbi:MAG: amidase [Alphaproteobacteria bacterium]|nr:amidase [Alphaproteobacteria bacterium]